MERAENIIDLNDKKVEISYPVRWGYKTIFDSDSNVTSIVGDILKGHTYDISFSKFSKDKKYASYSISVEVLNEEQRLNIFKALKGVAKYVL